MVNNKSFIVVFLQLIQALLAAVTVIYIARLLGAHDYGRYIYLITIASILPLFVGLGAEHVFLMEASKSPRLTPVFFGNALLIRILLTLITLTIIAFVLFLLQITDFWVIILISMGSLLAAFPNPLFLSFYRVKGIHIRPWLISFLGPLSFLIYLTFLGGSQTTIEVVALGFCISYGLTLMIFIIDIRKMVKFQFSIRYIKKYFKRGLVFSVSQGFDFAFSRLDIFLLQFVLGSYAVGIYAAGQRVVSLFQIVPSSFHVVELPEFHRVSGNLSLLTDKFRNLRKILIELGLLFFGLLSLNATYIIHILFGDEYLSASDIVIVLSASGLIFFINYPYYMLAEAINKIVQRMYIRIITFFATVILLYIFILFHGITGAAIGLFAGQILFLILLHHLTRSHNGRFQAIFVDSRILLTALAAFILAIIAHSFFENKIVALVIGSAIYVLIFLSIGHLLGWLKITQIIVKIWKKLFLTIEK